MYSRCTEIFKLKFSPGLRRTYPMFFLKSFSEKLYTKWSDRLSFLTKDDLIAVKSMPDNLLLNWDILIKHWKVEVVKVVPFPKVEFKIWASSPGPSWMFNAEIYAKRCWNCNLYVEYLFYNEIYPLLEKYILIWIVVLKNTVWNILQVLLSRNYKSSV